MMARSPTRSNLMQDRSPPARRNHLQRTAGPYIGSKCEYLDVRKSRPLRPTERTSISGDITPAMDQERHCRGLTSKLQPLSFPTASRAVSGTRHTNPASMKKATGSPTNVAA
jgi:hypothetical protein